VFRWTINAPRGGAHEDYTRKVFVLSPARADDARAEHQSIEVSLTKP